MGAIASVEPAALEVFRQLNGSSYGSAEQFGEAFSRAVTSLGSMPRFFSAEEAIDWAILKGYVAVKDDGSIVVDLAERS